jgi:hypothetical protein
MSNLMFVYFVTVAVLRIQLSQLQILFMTLPWHKIHTSIQYFIQFIKYVF